MEIERVEWRGDACSSRSDHVAREEPLEIRIGGVPIAVVMRTPGHDEELTWGFLLTERVIDDPARVRSVRHCAQVDTPEAENNVLQVVLHPEASVDLARLRRNLYASSSCGICGKATLDQVLARAPALQDDCRVSVRVLHALPERLRAAQAVFSRTGGLHAAGLFTVDGELLVVREDVGRHNAVDKVIGWAVTHGRAELEGHILVVSGRISYEITQKALAARIPVVAAVSAPSSLAIDLAHRGRLTLVGFVRDRRLCVYTETQRVVA